MRSKSTILAFVLAASLAGAASAQVISYSPRTGDVWIDTELGYVNDYGRRDRDYFVDDVVNSFGAPRYLVNELLGERRWSPGDVYYACALAYQAHRPCGDAVRTYEENRGKGWGVVAMRMGIKPGSAEFHAMKGQLGKSHGRYKARGPGHGPVQERDDHGNGDKAKGHDGDDDGPGNSGKAKGKGNGGDSGKGKDKDKGHGH